MVFRLDVDSDATPKDYGINSEIKYTDVNGDTVISESMKIPVDGQGRLLIPGSTGSNCSHHHSRSRRIHVPKEAEKGLMRRAPPPF